MYIDLRFYNLQPDHNLCQNTQMGYQFNIFSCFSMKTYVVGTHQKHLDEMLLMSMHNTCFCGKIRNISGPSCSKLTTSLVNDSLKFTSSDTQIF